MAMSQFSPGSLLPPPVFVDQENRSGPGFLVPKGLSRTLPWTLKPLTLCSSSLWSLKKNPSAAFLA